MFKQQRLTVLSISILLALLFAAVLPMPAMADDGAPPTTDAPVVADEPIVDVPVVDEPVAEEPVAEAPTEDLTLPEVLDATPAGTDLVVLDESGEALPLATEAAAEIILTGDPMWCPSDKTPADGVAGGCTASFSSFGALITELSNGTGTDAGAGTIYVAFDYNATTAGDAGNDIIFDYDAMHLTNLVFQGGWNFSSNSVVGNSTIDLGLANMLNFHDWEGSLTLNDIVLTNSDRLMIDGRGLDGVSTADVAMNNVGVTNTNFGAIISTAGDVVVNNSAFTGSTIGAGMEFWGVRNAEITNSVFTGNADRGARIWISGNAAVTNSTFNSNGQEGASISASGGNVTVTNSVFNGNTGIGSEIGTFNGDITINGGEFSGNHVGLQTQILKTLADIGIGDVTLNNVTVTGNTGTGADLNRDPGYVTDSHGNELFNTGNIFVNGGHFSNNMGGLAAYSFGVDNMILTNVTAIGNGYIGVSAHSAGNMTVNGGNFSDNNSAGMLAFSGGDVTLNNVTAAGNGGGVEADATGNMLVNGGNFSNNSGGGLAVWSYTGDATLNNVTATGNDHGAFAHAYDGNVTVNSGNFSNNAIGGLWADSSGITKFNNITAVGNGDGSEYSYGAGAYGNLDVICGNYSGNKGYGLWLGPYDGNAYLGGPNLNGNSLGGYYLDGGTVSFGLCGEGDGARGFKPQNNLLPQLPVSPQIVAQTTSLTLDELPARIPEGKAFVTELTVKLLLDGEEIDEAPRGVQVAFDIPADLEAVFTVLFWNGTEWVEIPSTVVDGKVVFSVTAPGIYVLASQ